MIIPTSSARILVYSQNYTTFGPSQLAFQCTVRSTLLLDRLSSHFSVQSKAIYFTGLSSLSESPLRALSATHILFWNSTGTPVLQSVLLSVLGFGRRQGCSWRVRRCPAGQAGGASSYPSWPPHCGGDSQERTPDPQGKATWRWSKISVCLWQGPAILRHTGFKAARTGTPRRTTCPLPPGQRQPRQPSGHTRSRPGHGLRRAPPHREGP